MLLVHEIEFCTLKLWKSHSPFRRCFVLFPSETKDPTSAKNVKLQITNLCFGNESVGIITYVQYTVNFLYLAEFSIFDLNAKLKEC